MSPCNLHAQCVQLFMAASDCLQFQPDLLLLSSPHRPTVQVLTFANWNRHSWVAKYTFECVWELICRCTSGYVGVLCTGLQPSKGGTSLVAVVLAVM